MSLASGSRCTIWGLAVSFDGIRSYKFRGNAIIVLGVELFTSLGSIVMSIYKGIRCFNWSLILKRSNEIYGSGANLRLSIGSIVSIRSSVSIFLCARKDEGCWYIANSTKTMSGNDRLVTSLL